MNETDNFMQVEEDELAQYEKKKARAIRLLKNIPQDDPIEISYSGGKDSDVILELAKMAGIPFRAIYKNTTIDPPGTIRYVKSKGVEILPPKMKFFDVVEMSGCPTRRVRTCCSHLKEYKVLDKPLHITVRPIQNRKIELDPFTLRVHPANLRLAISFRSLGTFRPPYSLYSSVKHLVFLEMRAACPHSACRAA